MQKQVSSLEASSGILIFTILHVKRIAPPSLLLGYDFIYSFPSKKNKD